MNNNESAENIIIHILENAGLVFYDLCYIPAVFGNYVLSWDKDDRGTVSSVLKVTKNNITIFTAYNDMSTSVLHITQVMIEDKSEFLHLVLSL